MPFDAAKLADAARRATSGEPEAFSEIVAAMQNAIVGYAWSLRHRRPIEQRPARSAGSAPRSRAGPGGASGNGAGVTALHLAAKEGQTEVAALLIDAGADLEARSSGTDAPGGGTALHWAAKWRQLDVVKLLVERGANVNPEADDSEQVRMGGAGTARDLFKDAEIARYLIDHGAKITIFAAVALGLEGQVRELVEADPELLAAREFVDFTPLHLAARNDRADMVELLLALGAPRDPTDRLDRSPIDVALLAGKRRAYDALVAHGAVPSPGAVVIAGDIERAVQLARFFEVCLEDVAEARRMLSADASLATAKLPFFWNDNYVGGTALHLAAALGLRDLAEVLLRCGADPSQRDERYGGSAPGWAKEFDRPEMAAFLESWPDPPPNAAP